MQCRYREKVVAAGDMIFVSVVPEWRKSGKRRGKYRATSEDQARLNEKYAALRFQFVIHANFSKRDFRLDLTYNDRYLPEDEEQFKRDLRNFTVRLRQLYRTAGIELKYVLVPAWSEKGRPHAHAIVTGGMPYKEIKKCWGMGTVAWRPLEFDERGICDLGFYYATQKRSGKTAPIHERAKGERRWSGSRNLVRPVERTNVTRYSRKALEEIADSGNPHEIFSKRYPGYWLSEFPSIRWNDVNKSWYLDAVLYRPDSDNLAEYARKDDSEIRGRRRKAGG
jgi:hypothetical protein